MVLRPDSGSCPTPSLRDFAITLIGHSTLSRTPLGERSARRRNLYLTTNSSHNGQTSMPTVGFERTISAGERPQTYALDSAATGTGRSNIFSLYFSNYMPKTYFSFWPGVLHIFMSQRETWCKLLNIRLNKAPTWCNKMQILLLQTFSTCFRRQAPIIRSIKYWHGSHRYR